MFPTSQLLEGLSLCNDHWISFSHLWFEILSNHATQKHDILWHWIKVGSLWEMRHIYCKLWLPRIISQLNGLDLSTSPTWTCRKKSLICFHTFAWVTWYLITSTSRTWQFPPQFATFASWDLICWKWWFLSTFFNGPLNFS